MFTGAELHGMFLAFARADPRYVPPTVEQWERVARMANEHLPASSKPAALFYAIGRWGRMLGPAWVDFARFAAGVVTYQQGGRLVLTRDTARTWLVDVAAQRLEVPELFQRLDGLTIPR